MKKTQKKKAVKKVSPVTAAVPATQYAIALAVLTRGSLSLALYNPDNKDACKRAWLHQAGYYAAEPEKQALSREYDEWYASEDLTDTSVTERRDGVSIVLYHLPVQ